MSSDFLKKFDENLGKLDRQIAESRRVSYERKKTFGFVAGKLEDLKGRVDELGKIVGLLKQRTNGLSANRGANSGRVVNNNEEIARLKQVIDQLSRERDDLKRALDGCNEELRATQKNLADAKNQFKAELERMSDQTGPGLADSKRELDDLKRKLASFEGEMNALLKERNGLRDQLQAATSGSVPIEARIKKLTDDNVRLLAENEMLLKKLNDAQNAIIQATTVLSELSGDNTDFDTIDALIGSLEQMLTAISRNAQQGGKKRKKSKTRKRTSRRRTQAGGFIYGRHSTGKGISRRQHKVRQRV
jgi:chromosome segregation ATPase